MDSGDDDSGFHATGPWLGGWNKFNAPNLLHPVLNKDGEWGVGREGEEVSREVTSFLTKHVANCHSLSSAGEPPHVPSSLGPLVASMAPARQMWLPVPPTRLPPSLP